MYNDFLLLYDNLLTQCNSNQTLVLMGHPNTISKIKSLLNTEVLTDIATEEGLHFDENTVFLIPTERKPIKYYIKS